MEGNYLERKGEKFNEEDDIKALAENWKNSATMDEPAGKKTSHPSTFYGYKATRYEGDTNSDGMGEYGKIERLHGESIIEKIIPRLLAELPQGRKLKILDNGGGAGIFTDQIREKFGDRVDVYSTGLSKQAAREYRKKKDLPKLHPNDLKWRSIQELSDFPEFDLIVDTYGEQYYRPKQESSGLEFDDPLYLSNVNEWYRHIDQVIKKLSPGGYATLAPVNFSDKKEGEKALEKIREKYGVKVYWGPSARLCIKIEKPKLR